MFELIRKRNGREETFQPEKITEAIFKAAQACGGEDRQGTERLCRSVIDMAKERYPGSIIDVEQIQDPEVPASTDSRKTQYRLSMLEHIA